MDVVDVVSLAEGGTNAFDIDIVRGFNNESVSVNSTDGGCIGGFEITAS